jgi:hypothetical protein
LSRKKYLFTSFDGPVGFLVAPPFFLSSFLPADGSSLPFFLLSSSLGAVLIDEVFGA